MTEWDHHDPTPGDPGPGWDFAADQPEPFGEPDHGLDPSSDPYDVQPGLPDEPAGLPAEHPVELPVESPWPTDGAGGTDHGAVPPGEPADLPDSTDPAAWTDGADDDPFPPALDLDVTPADGGPWTDPELIGGTADWSADPTDPPAALRSDLAAADGDPDAGWAALQDSDDPAVRALATNWQG